MSAATPATNTVPPTPREAAAGMRQAVIVTPERFEVRPAPRPSLRGEGEVLVRTLACGICSGDLMPWYLAKKVGSVLGHEVVGRAVEVGRDEIGRASCRERV